MKFRIVTNGKYFRPQVRKMFFWWRNITAGGHEDIDGHIDWCIVDSEDKVKESIRKYIELRQKEKIGWYPISERIDCQ